MQRAILTAATVSIFERWTRLVCPWLSIRRAPYRTCFSEPENSLVSERRRIDDRIRQMSICPSCEQRRFSFCGSCTLPKRLEVHFELIQASSRILGVNAAELSDPPAKCRFCSSCEQRRFSFCGSCTPPKRLEVHFELIQASSRILGVNAAELSDPPAKCRFCPSCEQRRFSFCGSCTPPKRLEVHFELIQASSRILVVNAAELSDPSAKCRFCPSCEQRRFSLCGSGTPPKRLEVHFELIQASSRILGVNAAELSDPPAKCRFCPSCEQRRFSFCGSCTPPKRLEIHFELIQASFQSLVVKEAELSDPSAKCLISPEIPPTAVFAVSVPPSARATRDRFLCCMSVTRSAAAKWRRIDDRTRQMSILPKLRTTTVFVLRLLHPAKATRSSFRAHSSVISNPCR